jgi:hypothetical protein
MDEINDTLEQWVALFDTALTSEDPRVKDQLRKLLMITALTMSPNAAVTIKGPFSELSDQIISLRNHISRIESELARQRDAQRRSVYDYKESDFLPKRLVRDSWKLTEPYEMVDQDDQKAIIEKLKKAAIDQMMKKTNGTI